MIIYTYGLVRRWISRIINPSKIISMAVKILKKISE